MFIVHAVHRMISGELGANPKLLRNCKASYFSQVFRKEKNNDDLSQGATTVLFCMRNKGILAENFFVSLLFI